MSWNERVETLRLPNGLTLHYQYYPEDVSSVVLLYRAGSAYERSGRTGVAHILEHLMFNGSRNYGPFSLYIDAWGGQDNAFTDRDITVYHTVVPTSRVADVLRLEADRMRNLLFAHFEAEKRVILEEYLLSENEDDERLWTEIFAHLWPDSPYSHPVSGWPEDVRNLTLKDVRDFYDRLYRPNNALLTVVSRLPLEKVLGEVENSFGNLEPYEEIRHPNHGMPTYRWFKRSVVRANRPKRFIVAFRLPQPSLRYNTAINVLTRVLDLERSSPLWPLIESGKMEMFNVRNYEYAGGNVLVIVGEVAPTRSPPVEDILAILESMPVDTPAVGRVKRMFKSEFVFSYEEVESVGINVALTAYLFGRVPTLSESLSLYDSITAEDLQAVKRDIISSPVVVAAYENP
ncbi:MAG: insulinase family protein [Thermotogae bacterium]|nr:insulinase family protein [Thermotogota bacterium]